MKTNQYKKASLEKRVGKVERRVAASKPEMKYQSGDETVVIPPNTSNTVTMTTIAQGTDVYQRIGNKIKVWRIEIRGFCEPVCSNYLIQSKGENIPVSVDFGGSNGAYLDNEDAQNNFVEWKYHKNPNYSNSLNLTQSFKNGIVVGYKGPLANDYASNQLHFVTLNRDTQNRVLNGSWKIWYTDC